MALAVQAHPEGPALVQLISHAVGRIRVPHLVGQIVVIDRLGDEVRQLCPAGLERCFMPVPAVNQFVVLVDLDIGQVIENRRVLGDLGLIALAQTRSRSCRKTTSASLMMRRSSIGVRLSLTGHCSAAAATASREKRLTRQRADASKKPAIRQPSDSALARNRRQAAGRKSRRRAALWRPPRSEKFP